MSAASGKERRVAERRLKEVTDGRGIMCERPYRGGWAWMTDRRRAERRKGE